MNIRGVFFLLGRLMLALAVALAAPASVAFYLGGPDRWAFAVTAVLALVVGLAMQFAFRHRGDFPFGRREAFVLVTAAWVTASLVGALPYIIFKGPGFIVDGLFESASGFTTTGASILTDIEAEPAGLLLWRSLTQWLGGMGIIVLGIAILPKLAVGGMELLGAEAPGPITEKLTPRIAQTAKLLWGLYTLITLAEVLALMACGVGLFEAVNHALATMATGGFSTRNGSIAGFGNPMIEIVIIFFMLLAGTNFALHFHLFRGRPKPLLKDPEFRLFMCILGVATALMTFDLVKNHSEGFLDSVRLAAFQATTMVTTTGFATANFDTWPHFSKALLFLLMFVGGCAGSTGGSVKVARIMIVLKKLAIDLRRLVRPRAVIPVRIGNKPIPEEIVASVTTFFILFLALFALGGMAMAASGMDTISAFSASAACVGNIGPGFGAVGPTMNFALVPVPAKLLLVVLMIVGRLELYTVLVLLFIWRKN